MSGAGAQSGQAVRRESGKAVLREPWQAVHRETGKTVRRNCKEGGNPLQWEAEKNEQEEYGDGRVSNLMKVCAGKKRTVLLLAGLMLFFLRAAAGESRTGEWYSEAVVYRDSIYPAEVFDVSSYLFIREDGTVQWKLRDTVREGKWKEKPEKDGVVLSFSGLELSAGMDFHGMLAMKLEKMTFLFGREKTDTLPPFRPTEAEDIRSFTGNWTLAYFESERVIISAQSPEYDIMAGLVIGEEQLSFLYRIGEDVSPQYDAPASFSDGKLALEPTAHEGLEIREAERTEGGYLRLCLYDSDEDPAGPKDMILYFSRADGSQ